MLGYIILKRKRFSDRIEVAEQSNNQASAEDYAQDIYNAEQLDMVAVAEVSKDSLNENGMRYKKVMKIERTCKHPNLQSDFIGGGMMCTTCGLVFKPQTISSNIEDMKTPQPQTA